MERNVRTHGLSGVAGCLLLALGLLSAPAAADLTFNAVVDPQDANSWYQSFHLSTTRAFTNVGLVLTPTVFDHGGASFKNPEWDFSTLGNPAHFAEAASGRLWTVASGDSTDDLLWRSHFSGDRRRQSFVLSLFAWDRSFAWQTAAAYWNGSRWRFGVTPSVTWEQFEALGAVSSGGTPVHAPAPSAVLMGVLGLFGVYGLKRRVH